MHDHAATLQERLAADLDGWFPELIRSRQDALFGGALRMVGNRQDAEDITQETLVRAYRALSGYPPERIASLRLEGWLWTIAANLCRNRHRGRMRSPTESIGDRDLGSPEPGPERLALDVAGQELLAAHLAALPWAMRSAVVLRHVVGLPYSEIAEALGRPVGTVKADVHRGLDRLRSGLVEEEI